MVTIWYDDRTTTTMKIGILTQPLKSNYGGILQNWALQQVLIKLGHEPITIDVLPRDLPFKEYIIANILSFVKLFIPNKVSSYHHLFMQRPKLFDTFIKDNIVTTSIYRRRKASIIHDYRIDALLVGSDQVWRPKYNIGCLDDMFLKFVEGITCPKASYAASFGVDTWEYSAKQTLRYKKLISKFDRVSVREQSGVKLCEVYFNVNAVQVLDPTLLLEKKDYIELIEQTPHVLDEPFLAAYVLNLSEEIELKIKRLAKEQGLKPYIIQADSCATLSVEQWLSIFRDADYIVTDSFHGSVFSYIFGKKFEFIVNQTRGASRFQQIEELVNDNSFHLKKKQSLDFLKTLYGTATD